MYDAGLVVAITLKITSNARSEHGKVIVKSARTGSDETPGILARSNVAGGANFACGGPVALWNKNARFWWHV